jgi:hypothetical protein
MKTTYLLATLVAAALPLAAVTAEDSSKPEATDQKQEQNSDMMGMKGMMGKGQMMSNWKEQDAELDKLVAEMNSASADKKLEAVVTVLNKLVQQRKAMHEQMQNFHGALHGRDKPNLDHFCDPRSISSVMIYNKQVRPKRVKIEDGRLTGITGTIREPRKRFAPPPRDRKRLGVVANLCSFVVVNETKQHLGISRRLGGRMRNRPAVLDSQTSLRAA